MRQYGNFQTERFGAWRIAKVQHALAQALPLLPRDDAVAVVGSALGTRLIDDAGLADVRRLLKGRRDAARPLGWLDLADRRDESPAETHARLSCIDDGVPPHRVQVEFRKDGRFLGRCDLGWQLRDGRRLTQVDTPIVIENLSGHIDYHEGWDLQRRTHEQVRADGCADTVFFLEHASVYTAGARTHRDEYPTDGTEVIKVDRGGKITWHGPGQIVAYPIVKLAKPFDVVEYIRTLEQAVMDVCAALGVETLRIEGRSGVWVAADSPDVPNPRRDRKVCAIGARVAKGVTMHGLALNCDADLSAFDHIVPCGIDDADVTSLTAELDRRVTVDEVRPLLEEALIARLAPLLVHEGAPSDAVPATA